MDDQGSRSWRLEYLILDRGVPQEEVDDRLEAEHDQEVPRRGRHVTGVQGAKLHASLQHHLPNKTSNDTR